MNGYWKKAGLSVAMAATVLSVAAPADAQRWRRYRGGGGGDAAAGAIIGGIVGLGLGAAIASSNNRDRYYDRGAYYDGRSYYSPPPRVVYRERYYAPPPRVYYERDYYRDYYDQPRDYYRDDRGW